MQTGTIIIVAYNSGACIANCLRSAIAARDWGLVVVDNASDDDTVEIARREAPNAKLLLNSHNLGFSGAVNQAVKVAEGEVLVVLNPDITVLPGALDRLAHTLAQDKIGAAGGLLTDDNGSPDIGFTLRRFPKLSTAVCEVLLLNRMWYNNPSNRRYRCLDLDYTKGQQVEQPAGACLAFKRAAWEQLDGFDEGFFPVWFEDVDFCRRLHDHGWEILYCPDAIFVHSGGHSVKKVAFADRQEYWYKNLLRYFAKHHSGLEVSGLRLAIIAGLLLRSLLCLLGFRPHGMSRYESICAYLQTAWNYGVRGRGAKYAAASAAAGSAA